MSEPKLISPLLDNFVIGEPISDHAGVRCLPAMDTVTEDKYIVKIISVPATQTQLDALLLTGAYPDAQAAKAYFADTASKVTDELKALEQLARLEGFLSVSKWQVVEMEEPEIGYDIYILSPYKRTLERHLNREPMTHLGAINLGLDLCAALTVCRRSGYLYIDLKPSNVFLTGEREYRIGDLGFVSMDELRFTSLPDKYRSAYTAPEITDAFSALNTTIDVYAAGLILYRCYNNGQLPFTEEFAPAERFPAPEYADYELSEIILKACDLDPQQRYQDPVAFAQALVSYMQRNGVNDDPIVPPAVPLEEEPVMDSLPQADTDPEELYQEELPQQEMTSDEAEAADKEEVLPSQEPEAHEDTAVFLIPEGDETTQELDEQEIAYEEVSDEVSQILSQADELAAHPVPEPVVAPEAIDIPTPEPIVLQPQENADIPEAEDEDEEASITDEPPVEPEEPEELADSEDIVQEDDGYEAPKKRRHPVRTVLLILLGAALIGLGFLYYKFIFIKPIKALLVQGSENNLTVSIQADVDYSDLYVTCSTYGSKVSARFSDDGKAQFTQLVPNTQYKIEIGIDGFHMVTGETTASYYTPRTVSLEQISCVTGATDGSALIRFTPSTSDQIQWNVRYSSEDQSDQAEASNNTVTLEGLVVGAAYTVEIIPEGDVYLTGENTLTFVAAPVIRAQELHVTSWKDGTLSAAWSAPEGTAVSSWSVHCFDGASYNQVITTSETSVAFEGVSEDSIYTIEVLAEGQSINETLLVESVPVNAENFKSESDGNGGIRITWDGDIPQGGWILRYEISDMQGSQTIACTEASAVIPFALPGRTYTFTLESADGSSVAQKTNTYSVPEAQDFTSNYGGFTITRNDIVLSLCTVQEAEKWESWQIAVMDRLEKAHTFAPGDSAALAAQILKVYDPYTEEDLTVAYVIIGSDGQLYSTNQEAFPWPELWNKDQYRGMLTVPELPQNPGEYTLLVYFNGGLAAQLSFTIA